ncbi:POK25 protein, partial [Zapornia atra]|nr:POK25 protein [Zapornia atra]
FLTEGNARVDHLAAPAWSAPVPGMLEQTRLSHAFFHQSTKMLQRQFHIPWAMTRTIVQTCPNCQPFAPIQITGVNPRGLQALQIWQTDVTHIPEFGRQKYVQVYINTSSAALWATAE